MTIRGLLRKVEAMDTGKVIQTAMEQSIEALEKKNKEQLLSGKNREGDDIFPSYQDDPYFKTPEAAQRYSDWKDKITPGHNRKPGTPNLFITGKYHRSREIVFSGDTIKYSASFLGPQIEAKYGDQIGGLGGEFKKEFLSETLRPALNKEINLQTGLKFGK